MKVLRDGEEKELKATLTGQTEKSRGDIQNSMGGELSGRRSGFPAVLQTDMVVEPKNCGGPIVDLDGKLNLAAHGNNMNGGAHTSGAGLGPRDLDAFQHASRLAQNHRLHARSVLRARRPSRSRD